MAARGYYSKNVAWKIVYRGEVAFTYARTRAKAHYVAFASISDVWPEAKWTSIQVMRAKQYDLWAEKTSWTRTCWSEYIVAAENDVIKFKETQNGSRTTTDQGAGSSNSSPYRSSCYDPSTAKRFAAD